jgi:hypothetical protein
MDKVPTKFLIHQIVNQFCTSSSIFKKTSYTCVMIKVVIIKVGKERYNGFCLVSVSLCNGWKKEVKIHFFSFLSTYS